MDQVQDHQSAWARTGMRYSHKAGVDMSLFLSVFLPIQLLRFSNLSLVALFLSLQNLNWQRLMIFGLLFAIAG